MKTVNSLSGGKTSSYLAVHYPADYEVFAVVCADDHNAGRDLDKWLVRKVNEKLEKQSSNSRWPEFRATTEDPRTLTAILDLEQKIGREIIWLRGMGWEEMVKKRKAIPNKNKRFCTSVMKIQPIFEYCYNFIGLPVDMRVGFRYDEEHRRNTFKDTYKYANRCEYRPKSATWIHRWEEMVWRVGSFPLVDNKITHFQVANYWEMQGIEFPPDSNCQNCFWKHPQQLRKNMDENPAIMQWSKVLEEMHDHTFNDEYSLLQIEKMGIQETFAFGGGSGCQAGFCTD
jgi:hypothetical protein